RDIDLTVWVENLRKVRAGKDPFVRQQLAYTLGTPSNLPPEGAEFLAKLLSENADDRYILAAGLSSLSSKSNTKRVAEAMAKQPRIPLAVYPALLAQPDFGEPGAMADGLLRQMGEQKGKAKDEQFLILGEILDTLDRRHTSLAAVLKEGGIHD